MSFIVGQTSMLAAPKKLMPLLFDLIQKGDYHELFYMRRMLVFEMLEAAERLRSRRGYSDNRIFGIKARIRGIQWRMEVEMGSALMYSDGAARAVPKMSKESPIDVLACGFWDGAALVNDAISALPTGLPR